MPFSMPFVRCQPRVISCTVGKKKKKREDQKQYQATGKQSTTAKKLTSLDQSELSYNKKNSATNQQTVNTTNYFTDGKETWHTSSARDAPTKMLEKEHTTHSCYAWHIRQTTTTITTATTTPKNNNHEHSPSPKHKHTHIHIHTDTRRPTHLSNEAHLRLGDVVAGVHGGVGGGDYGHQVRLVSRVCRRVPHGVQRKPFGEVTLLVKTNKQKNAKANANVRTKPGNTATRERESHERRTG